GPPLLDEDYLILSTIHSAKGLEWDVVHVIHAADGMIPSDMATGNAQEIEEERRLLYVAMTRARDALHLYFPLRYYHRPRGLEDGHSYAQLSRFLTPEVRSLFDESSAPGAETMPPAGDLLDMGEGPDPGVDRKASSRSSVRSSFSSRACRKASTPCNWSGSHTRSPRKSRDSSEEESAKLGMSPSGNRSWRYSAPTWWASRSWPRSRT